MHYQAKMFTLSPHIDSKKSYLNILVNDEFLILHPRGGGGGALWYLLGGYVLLGTPNWHPFLKKNSPKIDTPF